ncbi:MAG TPA: T9SS type A sorting domain-containing protein [Bacteroidales bacterium]|nr:T9SS type A sorting domain-containing protein [Bacteroidales bacterium]
MKRLCVWLWLGILTINISAQDTIRVLHYNLLYYGINFSGCTSSNNNPDQKDQWLSTIINYTRPDIFSVNELGRGPSENPTVNVTRILNNVLNTQGRTQFSAAGYTNVRGSDIVNMLFYNHHKFTLHSQDVVTSITRDINLYRLYINNMPRLALGDTTFIIAIVAHFKAGSAGDDLTRRANEASAVMAYLDTRNIRGNVMFLADFNMKNAFEQAFLTLTQYHTAVYRFHDPVEVPGDWFENPAVVMYHSQSTRASNHDCFIAGGLDDRFDMILLSRSLLLGDQGLQYVSASYEVVGQDGMRLNQSLNSPVNNSAPAAVINALYNMSDHLPVALQLVTRQLPQTIGGHPEEYGRILFNNPVRDYLNIHFSGLTGVAEVSVYSVTGDRVHLTGPKYLYEGFTLQIDVSHLKPGIYIIRVISQDKLPISKMLIKF